MRQILVVLFVSIVCWSCSPYVSVTSSWKNTEALATPKTYNKVFISALSGSETAKNTVETALANAAQKRGYTAVRSMDAFTGSANPDKEAIVRKLKELGCDAIFTVALVNKESETRYTPGTTTYSPYPRVGYYGTYWGYRNYWYNPVYSSPGYYTTERTYFIESNLYDTETEKILWSAQSQTVNPSDLQSFSESYTKAIIKKLESDGLLRK